MSIIFLQDTKECILFLIIRKYTLTDFEGEPLDGELPVLTH